MKAYGCMGACTVQCRNDRAAMRRTVELLTGARQNRVNGLQEPRRATPQPRLKPSALRILGRLQKGPATNKELMDLAGFRYGARCLELRRAGHVIEVHGVSGIGRPGLRWYSLEVK